MNRQAAGLYRLKSRDRESVVPGRGGPIVALTSGTGGVGKSTLAANLATELGGLGRRVLLVDADLGLAGVELLLGVSPEHRIDDVLAGRVEIEEALVPGPEGVTLLPVTSGAEHRVDPGAPARARLLGRLWGLSRRFDLTLVDAAPGFGRMPVDFTAVADLRLVVVTPEPTAVADGYAMVKILAERGPNSIALVLNRLASIADGPRVARRFTSLTERFLSLKLPVIGCIEEDPALPQAALGMAPLHHLAAHSPAARAIRTMARKLLCIGTPERDGQGLVTGREPSPEECFSPWSGS